MIPPALLDSPGRSPGRLQALLAALAAGLAALPHALDTLADPDLWWHVRTGLLILERRALPAVDPFSFTAQGRPWTNHEWLSDVVFAAVFRAGGGAGLTLLRLLLLALATGLLFGLLRRRSGQPLLAAAALAACLTLFAGFVNVRPHSFTYVLTLAALAVVDRGRARPGAFFLLPPILALWANLHGGFLVGWGIAVAGIGAALVGRGGASRLDRRTAASVLVLGFAAPLCNPRGAGLIAYIWRELGSSHATVSEWKSLGELPGLVPVFLAAVLPPLVALATAPRRARLDDAALFFASALLAYRHLRFLPLALIFGGLVVATALGAGWRRLVEPREALRRALSRPAALGALCLVLAALGVPRFASQLERKGLGLEVDPAHTPVLAVRLLGELDLGSNLATRLDWGGYALFHLWPRYRVSIDGRNVTVYPEDFVAEQIRAYDRGEPLAGLGGHRVDVALVESRGPGFDGMSRLPGWQLVFRDPAAAVFVPTSRLEELRRQGPPAGSYEFRERVLTFP